MRRSEGPVRKGNRMRSGPCAAARSSARSWARNASGARGNRRRARSPSAGFAQVGPPGARSSRPTSHVRTVTGCGVTLAGAGRRPRAGAPRSATPRARPSRYSERKSPMPSAPCKRALSASSGNSTFARSTTRTSSRVTAASACMAWRRSSSARSRSWAARKLASMGAEGSVTTWPRVPSTTTSAPGAMRRVASRRPTTAGTPNERARIDVWYVAEPSSVATASTRSQSSSAVSDGVRPAATSTKLPGSRCRDGASPAPPRFSSTRPSTSSRSVLRSRK